ncbi:MAG TPA: hypothetical protein DCQ99_04280 [Nitrospinae bacterium]|nr:hypothetical protein [Nitrospinota bacterium]
MKLKTALILFTIHFSLFNASAQSWQELMDSTKAYQEKQDYQTSLLWAQKALVNAEKEFGKDTNYASTLNKIADIFYNSGKIDSAIYYQEIHLNLFRNLYKEDHPNLSSSINNLGFYHNNQGNFKEAEQLFKEALDMDRRLYRGDHPDLALSINNLATIYDVHGNSIDAESLYKEAIEMIRRLFKGDHPDLALMLHNFATFYGDRGNLKEAELLINEAVEMYKRVYKGDHPNLAKSTRLMAYYCLERCDYNQAEILYKESLEMRRRLFKKDHAELAKGINGMASFYIKVGNYKKAEHLFKEALDMNKRLFKGDHPNLAIILNNMAYFFYHNKNFDEAETYFKEAMEMRRRIFKDDHPYLATSIDNMAMLYFSKRNYKEAEPLFKEALEMFRRLFKEDHPDLAYSINNMAEFNNISGNYIVAESLFRESLEMRRRLLNNLHPDLTSSINDMANFLCERNRFSEAEPLLEESFEITLKNIRNYFPYLNDLQKMDYWSTLEYGISNYLSFGAEYSKTKPEILEKMVDVTLATKGIVLNSTQKAFNSIRKDKDVFDTWQSTRQFWLQLVQNPDKAKKMGINVDSVERAAAELEKEISGQSSEFRKAFDTSLVRWRDVQNKLGSSEAAIEIIRNQSRKDTVKYLVLITKKDSKIPELVSLANGIELENSYIKRYKGLIDIQARGTELRDIDLQELKELYNQFWKPIQQKLGGISTAYVSMDGVYNQFNPNTLLNPVTNKYVLEEIDLRFLTSTRDLVKDAKYANEPKPIPMDNAVLFGAPEFELKKEVIPRKKTNEDNSQTRNYYLGGLLDEIAKRGISPLPGTRIEVNKITSSFELKNIKAEDFLGEQALEENVKSAKNPKILHIATHGVFLKDVEYMTMDFETDMKKHIENPLLRSMLLFSGAENTIKGETSDDFTKDDGILTAFEVMNLDLDETELVVLSACKTGLGEIKNGEGVYGLQRAFKVAGAKSIVMSLWSVNDETTQLLMTKFYENWLGGMTKREAFRKAQLHVKSKHPDFYHWGAFVMVGE